MLFFLCISVLVTVISVNPALSKPLDSSSKDSVKACKAKEGCLLVAIEGLSNDSGLIRVALFDRKECFSDKRYHISGAIRSASLPIRGKAGLWRLDNLPYGDYAIRTFHDEDESGQFKVNRFGIPKYEYGFSNDAKALFGPPPFQKAKFSFRGNKTITITMHR